MPSDIVTGYGEATASEADSHFIKKKCLTCNRHLSRKELYVGLCPYCLEDRATSTIYHFRPTKPNEIQFPKCFECNATVHLIGLKTWDVTAKSWKLLCTRCGELQLKKDEQFRNTPWGWRNKL